MTSNSFAASLILLLFFKLSIIFFFIGYSTFFVLVIRADSNTPINEYKPNTAKGLVSYLNRDAYGDTPLSQGNTGPYHIGIILQRQETMTGDTQDTQAAGINV